MTETLNFLLSRFTQKDVKATRERYPVGHCMALFVG